jgi:hypothetical protein
MNLHVYGPVSVRRNGNFNLHRSGILQKLEELQLDEELKFVMHGDSAYGITDYLISGGGRGMAAVRETIEWDYKDLKTHWKYCDYRHALQLRKQPVAKIILVCMILRNAHNCMNGGETSNYFRFSSPSFEEWVAQGPRAHPIPPDNIFANLADRAEGYDINQEWNYNSDDEY